MRTKTRKSGRSCSRILSGTRRKRKSERSSARWRHHHYDHIGGNTELKKKFGSVVLGFNGDAKRIPEIDILLKDNEIWNSGNFKAKIIHIPGHTTGHICFYFFEENLLFTGDTLFSLGCGRIFEGTYEQMYNSLNKLKSLPKETKIYCGHEYTLNNSKFCLEHDSENSSLLKKMSKGVRIGMP